MPHGSPHFIILICKNIPFFMCLFFFHSFLFCIHFFHSIPLLSLLLCLGSLSSLNSHLSYAGRRIPITLPNTGALARKRNSFYLRAILVICLVLFAVLQLHLINSRKYFLLFFFQKLT